MNLSSDSESKNFRFSSFVIPLQCKLYFKLRWMYSSVVPITFAGLPPTTVCGATDFVTILPAATIAPSPMVTPGIICEKAPIYAQSSITTLPNASKSGYSFLIEFSPHDNVSQLHVSPVHCYQWLSDMVRLSSHVSR